LNTVPLIFTRAALALAAGLLSGCATSADPTRRDVVSSEQLATGETGSADLKPYYQRLHMEGEANATLNRMRLASAAMQCGQWADAERNLDEVIRAIEALGPADERSRQALDEFHPEDIKKFKGEPYERAMAWFLRGVLYLRKQQWDNARACFKSAQLQGSAGKSDKGSTAWLSARWLEGWCCRQLREEEDARRCWEDTAGAKLPAPAPANNALCLLFLGWGPLKIPAGAHGETLTYREAQSRTQRAAVRIGNATTNVPTAEDLYATATGRGRRHMDDVNTGKADLKDATQTTGDVLITGGAVATTVGGATDNTTVAAAGLGALAAGAASGAVASSVQAKADTRAWDLLPARIALLPMTVSASQREVTIRFLDAGGNEVRVLPVSVPAEPQPSFIFFQQR
jgi:tetratricopeptide (TPR) repeat protein